jgi:hypothetical protein
MSVHALILFTVTCKYFCGGNINKEAQDSLCNKDKVFLKDEVCVEGKESGHIIQYKILLSLSVMAC